MKQVIKNKSILIVLLMILVIVSLSVILVRDLNTPGIASATTNPTQSIEELCAEYTDSDIIPKIGLTIREYPTELALDTISSDFETVVHADDHIVNIIPRQYFVERGEHFYIGKEYGFFVSTKEMYTNSESNLIIALVFDINSMRDMEQTQNRVIVKVQPLFQYYYAYLTQADNYYIIPQTGAYVYWTGISRAGNVIPLVLSETEALPSTEFYLKDISFSITLYNEQELNTINKRYRAKDDDGSFIIQYDYYYDGINRTSQGFDVTPHDIVSYVTTGVDLLCCVAEIIVPTAGPVIGVVGTLTDIVDKLNLFSEIVEQSNQTGPVDVDVSNGAITATCLYTTRRDQLAHYVDAETQKPALTKSATIFVRGDDRRGNIWYKAGNSAEGYFTLSDSAETTPWYTRYIQEIALSVVDKDGNEHVSQAVGSQTHMLYDPIYKPGCVGSNELAFLPQGKQYVSFRPQFTGDYEITFDKPYEFNVAVVDTQTNQKTIITPVDGKYKYRFVGGNIYNLEAYSPYGDIINMTFEPVDNTVSQSFDAKGQNVFKYVSTENQIVTLSSSSNDVRIKKVYQQNASGSLVPIAGMETFRPCAEAEIYMQARKTYYILMESTTSLSVNAFVAIEKCNNVLNTASIRLEGGENSKYYRFTPNESLDYIVLFESNIMDVSENDDMEFCCLDQYGNEIAHSYGYGYLILKNLVANKDYYIGIRSTTTMTVTPTINKRDVAFVWKMKVDGEYVPIENELHLKRGNTYEFALWINGVKARYYTVNNQYSNYFEKTCSSQYCGVNIKANARDAAFIIIKAKCDELMEATWEYDLTVFAEYDESKVSFDIDYRNATKLTIKDQDQAADIISWDMTIYLGGRTFRPPTITSKTYDIYSKLVEGTVSSGVFVRINKIIIRSYVDGDQRVITSITKDFNINTAYSTTSVENGKTIYHISNGLQLYNSRYNQNYKRVLDNDISLAEFKDKWTPIPSLRCDIDGKNYSITNLKLILDAPYSTDKYGLVANNYATISNLTLANFNMSFGWEEKPNWMYVGSFAGVNYGTIQNCQAYGSIYGYREYMSVGGIVGQNHSGGKIISTTYGRPVGTGVASVAYSWGELGGIAGQNYGFIQHTRVLNTKIQHRVYGSSRSIGGIAGYAENCEIANCAVEDSRIENINDQVIKSFTPKMGIIFGHMVNGTITSVGARNVQTSTGKLNNTIYCFKGGWGFLGLMENCVVDGNVGQYAP